MQFKKPMVRATLLRRYKRFLADVRLEDGSEITVHCPNSGRMTACCEPGRPVILSDSQNPKRKLRFTWELIQMGRTWVGVHSALSNDAIAHFVEAGKIGDLQAPNGVRREVKYGVNNRSRIDLLLPGDPDTYVEVKHSTMRVGEHAAFPDAVSERGRKHLRDLITVCEAGKRAVMVYAVGRSDCERFRPADEVDPEYGQALRHAVAAGVEVIALRLKYSPRGIALVGPVPFDLP